MNSEELIPVANFWRVSGTKPKGLINKYDQNFNVGIVARNVEEAIALALEIYRDGKVFNCNHGGAVHRIKIL